MKLSFNYLSPPRLVLIILFCLSRSALSQTLRYECYAHLEGADHNRDNKLNREEFTNAVNRMGKGHNNDALEVNNFMELPLAIQEAFTRLSCRCLALGQENVNVAVSCCGGEYATVDISGIVPGTRPTSAEAQLLDETCQAIDDALAKSKISNADFRFKSWMY
ncbi:hypothetical protein MHU86_24739 [Fragilaria crotonensis]|nr:hypothetical protein MHU86_24739 [Fragilaria crotonensis]